MAAVCPHPQDIFTICFYYSYLTIQGIDVLNTDLSPIPSLPSILLPIE